ncbi:hypothetical protein [Deinococcus planocerae]|uniref:GspE/PulE/PilB domain-containing protein n=1 Tax=Deinococcus planocerae TaxID=1737569 RepID=UPI000C7EB9C3|nr:hypothetical protein [Deinococcus planocerae]
MKQPTFADVLRSEARLTFFQFGRLRPPGGRRWSRSQQDAHVLERARTFLDEEVIGQALAAYGVPQAERALRVLDAVRALVEAEADGQTVRASSHPFQEENLYYLPPSALIVVGRPANRPSEPAWVNPPPTVPESEYRPPVDLAALATQPEPSVPPSPVQGPERGTGPEVVIADRPPDAQITPGVDVSHPGSSQNGEPRTLPERGTSRRMSIPEALLQLGYGGVETSELSDPRLEQTLLKGRRISEDLAFRALALARGLPFVDVRLDPPREDAAHLLDEPTCKTYRVFGHRLDDGTFFVLTDQPYREAVLRKVAAERSGQPRVKVLVTGSTALDRLLRGNDPLPPQVEKSVHLEQVGEPHLTLLLTAGTTIQPGEVTDYLGTDFDPDLHALLLACLAHTHGRVVVLRVPGTSAWPLETVPTERRYPALAHEDARALVCTGGWPDEDGERLTAEWTVGGSGAVLRALAQDGEVRFESLVLERELLEGLSLPDPWEAEGGRRGYREVFR